MIEVLLSNMLAASKLQKYNSCSVTKLEICCHLLLSNMLVVFKLQIYSLSTHMYNTLTSLWEYWEHVNVTSFVESSLLKFTQVRVSFQFFLFNFTCSTKCWIMLEKMMQLGFRFFISISSLFLASTTANSVSFHRI